MDPISKVVSLLESIREKHGSAATFTIKNLGEHITYATYVADDVTPAHRDHPDLHSAMLRLQIFVDVDDLAAHNGEIARQKLRSLREQKEHICDEIEEYERYL